MSRRKIRSSANIDLFSTIFSPLYNSEFFELPVPSIFLNGSFVKINFSMWRQALNVIPSVSKSEWDELDLISRWLISTRAAVLVMTFISAALAGLFALRDQTFNFFPWVALTLGLILAHASNNIFNDFTDFVRGVDENNYYRRERVYGSFKRRFNLPAEVNLEMIKADYKNGVLKIDIPKPEKVKPRKITIH